jgi:putative membrane protein
MYARHIALTVGSVLLLGLACPAMAQGQDSSAAQTRASTTTTSTTTSTSSKASKDAMFIREAAAGNLAEIKMGRIALDKSSAADVKQFAQRLVDDHTKANDQLMTLAQQKQITLPTEPMAKAQTEAKHLESMNGAAFDKAWTASMVKDHKKDIAKYTRESTHAKDADVRQYASSTLPTLKTHLQMAEQIKTSGTMAHGSMSGGSMHSANPSSSSSTH